MGSGGNLFYTLHFVLGGGREGWVRGKGLVDEWEAWVGGGKWGGG